jgi:hypothetical protein
LSAGFGIVGASDVPVIAFRICDANGRLAGTALDLQPPHSIPRLNRLGY